MRENKKKRKISGATTTKNSTRQTKPGELLQEQRGSLHKASFCNDNQHFSRNGNMMVFNVMCRIGWESLVGWHSTGREKKAS